MMYERFTLECLYCGKRREINYYEAQNPRCGVCRETKMLKVTEISAAKGDVFGYQKVPQKVGKAKAQGAADTAMGKRPEEYDQVHRGDPGRHRPSDRDAYPHDREGAAPRCAAASAGGPRGQAR